MIVSRELIICTVSYSNDERHTNIKLTSRPHDGRRAYRLLAFRCSSFAARWRRRIAISFSQRQPSEEQAYYPVCRKSWNSMIGIIQI
jgi:hypothetical protein